MQKIAILQTAVQLEIKTPAIKTLMPAVEIPKTTVLSTVEMVTVVPTLMPTRVAVVVPVKTISEKINFRYQQDPIKNVLGVDDLESDDKNYYCVDSDSDL